MIGGIGRHPNGIVNHFVNDQENALAKFDNKPITIVAGDMNINLIKFENDNNTINYLTTLRSNQYLPYFALPTRMTDFLATCIDHIFVRIAKISTHNLIKLCLASLTVTSPTVCLGFSPLNLNHWRKNCTRFIEVMGNENWDSVFTAASNWYFIFVVKYKQKNEPCFPLVQILNSGKPFLTMKNN